MPPSSTGEERPCASCSKPFRSRWGYARCESCRYQESYKDTCPCGDKKGIKEKRCRELKETITTGRVASQYQSGAQTRRVEALNAAAPGPFVELHPRLAERLGVAEGDALAVTSRRGRAVAPARITGTIRADTVFMPFHWPGEGRANNLTNPALDPTSRMPEFKVCAVRVEAAG